MRNPAYLFLILIILLFSGGLLPAQDDHAKPDNIKRLLREGKGYFLVREYINAIPYLEQALQIENDNLEANFYIGLCYLKSLERNKALAHLLKVHTLSPNYDPLMDYYLAESYKYNNQMETAINAYETAKSKFAGQEGKVKVMNDELSNKDFIALIDQRLREARYGVSYLADPTNAQVRNLGEVINSEYGDYAPVITADESMLIFTSRRKGSTGKGIDPEDNLFYEDIYFSTQKKGEWTEPKDIGKNINTKFHEASIGLSPKGQTLFIYKDENNGDIYSSEQTKKADWSAPVRMGGNINSRFREPSISITDDGNTIYFSSDRPGGFGGLDIYVSKKDDKGNWSDPVNLGAGINTPEDEDSPFIHFDAKTLYFSSKGHRSMGGYDIFFSELINEQWTEPKNLGYPINTPQDDIHFVLSADYKTGYYASAKDDTYGDKDIYEVKMPDYKDVEVIDFALSLKTVSVGFNPLTTKDPRRAVVILRGVVKDELSDELISAKMTLIDVEENEIVDEINSVSPKGVYYTTMNTGRKYLLHVQKEGYLFHSEYFEIPVGVVNQEKVLQIYLKRLKVTQSVDFKALFDYNSAKLKTQSLPALLKLQEFLETNPNVKGILEGHTDDIGTNERNKTLSEERAKSVYNYLIEQGIDRNRLSFIGYGEEQPLADNETAYGRSLNRRTVFKIVEIN